MKKSKNKDYTVLYILYAISMMLMAFITFNSNESNFIFWAGTIFLALGLVAIIGGKIIEFYGLELKFTIALALLLIIFKLVNYFFF